MGKKTHIRPKNNRREGSYSERSRQIKERFARFNQPHVCHHNAREMPVRGSSSRPRRATGRVSSQFELFAVYFADRADYFLRSPD